MLASRRRRAPLPGEREPDHGALTVLGALMALAGCGTPDGAPPADPGPTTVRVEATRPAPSASLPLLPTAEQVDANRVPENPIDERNGSDPAIARLLSGTTPDERLGILRAQILVGDVGRSLGELAPADYADVGLEDDGVSPVIFMLTPRGVELAQEAARLADLEAEVRLTATTGAALAEASGLLQADETLRDLDLDVRPELNGLAVDVEHDDHAAAVDRVRELRLPTPVDRPVRDGCDRPGRPDGRCGVFAPLEPLAPSAATPLRSPR